MKLFNFFLIVFPAFVLATGAHADSAITKKVYQDAFIDQLLKAEESQDAKVAVLTRLIENTEDASLRTNGYCRRGKLRIVHTHLSKGVDDLQACVEGLNAASDTDSQTLELARQKLDRAKRKYEYTKALAEDKQGSLVTRYTALWKLGEREQAVAAVKAEAVPEKFSSLSANRMVKTGYLCKGVGPNGPEKSFRTKAGTFWWCDEL